MLEDKAPMCCTKIFRIKKRAQLTRYLAYVNKRAARLGWIVLLKGDVLLKIFKKKRWETNKFPICVTSWGGEWRIISGCDIWGFGFEAVGKRAGELTADILWKNDKCLHLSIAFSLFFLANYFSQLYLRLDVFTDHIIQWRKKAYTNKTKSIDAA